jgi:release factor glutamine methyltransferase
MAGTSVGEALARGGLALTATSETAHRDAQVLLADRMGRPREWLLSHPESPMPAENEVAFVAGLQRLAAGEPLPYVLGWWEFYGRRFTVTPDVLIPRPETELLVEKGLLAIDEHPTPRMAVDLGTGSGCVGVTLALERRNLEIIASDISRAALALARANAIRHEVEGRLALVNADLSAGLPLADCVLLANLPYVATEEAGQLLFEPRLATEGGDTGLEVVTRLLGQFARRRPTRTTALLEIGAGQGRALVDLATALCRPTRIWLDDDLAGHDRILGMRFEEG